MQGISAMHISRGVIAPLSCVFRFQIGHMESQLCKSSNILTHTNMINHTNTEQQNNGV